jgi:outer membrane protein
MRILLTVCLAAAAFLWAAPAQAQFENRHFGISGGYLSVSSDIPISMAIPLSLEAGSYLQDGWEWYVHIPLMIVQESILQENVFGVGTHAGLRYLFAEEDVRPYIGAELAGLYLLETSRGNLLYGGPGAVLGLEVFVSDSVSIGARVRGDFFLNLKESPIFAGGGQVTAAAYF